MPIVVDLEQLSGLLVSVAAILGAVFTALWVAMVIWTFRDMRSRTRDPFAQILAAVTVAVLNVPGLLVYLILRPQESLAEQYQRALEEEALLQEIEEKQVCPGCGSPTKETWRICPYCHTRLKKPCVNCSQLLDLSWQVCPHCETAQHGAAVSVRHARRSAPYEEEFVDAG
ncbi:MAG: zinc ribbon domain-containing protein [Anaerolineae bacterium]